jgi:hypothetical protein
VELVGGDRTVQFNPGFNVIIGDISTGKTTFVRLIRAMLGTEPKLPREVVEHVTATRGEVVLGSRAWQIYRPRTSAADALVEVSEVHPDADREPVSLRLPVARADRTYSTFLLDQLHIPTVAVPQARTEPTTTLLPVTMTDWLNYCIITGDELDTQVFGNRQPFRDSKRRWVFELAYGLYEPEVAQLNAELRKVERQLATIDDEAAIRAQFLANTPFADVEALQQRLDARTAEYDEVLTARRQMGAASAEIPGVQELQQTLLAARSQRADMAERLTRLDAQIKDLTDLRRQLASQSARLTRAIVAGEWLVDFDFVVCPRCGNEVHAGRTDPSTCYLCLQTPLAATSQDHLLAEQDRIVSQIRETDEVVQARQAAHGHLTDEAGNLDAAIAELAAGLDRRTQTFVSDRAAQIEYHAAEQARLEAEITRLRDYITLLRRHEDQLKGRDELEARRDELAAQISGVELSQTDAEANIRALEQRMLGYLQELNIPDLGDELSVRINRRTYLPEVSGRTFGELSSQGLTTLVNIAHALAHHTVAIDRDLPMPGLLILDGLSANAGHEGFDLDRVRDAYQLLRRTTEQYHGALQVVAVDNDLARRILFEVAQHVVLTLTQEDKLIRIPSARSDASPASNTGPV